MGQHIQTKGENRWSQMDIPRKITQQNKELVFIPWGGREKSSCKMIKEVGLANGELPKESWEVLDKLFDKHLISNMFV